MMSHSSEDGTTRDETDAAHTARRAHDSFESISSGNPKALVFTKLNESLESCICGFTAKPRGLFHASFDTYTSVTI